MRIAFIVGTFPYPGGYGATLETDGLVHGNTPRPPVSPTPNSIVHSQDKLRLRYYAPPSGPRRAPVVV